MKPEKGIQKQICDNTGLHKSIVSRYFNSKYIGNKNIFKIEDCLSKMGRNHLKNQNVPIINIEAKKGTRRTDIINNLAFNDQKKLAIKFYTNKSHINQILTGSSSLINQNSKLSKDITREAELMAAINIWKTRFCKYKSLL